MKWYKFGRRWYRGREICEFGSGSGECEVQAEDGLAGLLEDKKICRMVSDEKCVMCDSRVA